MTKFTSAPMASLGDAINAVRDLHPYCMPVVRRACEGGADEHWQISTGDFESGDAVYTYMDGTLELIP